MQHNEEFLDHWERIVNEVNKTEVPLECIKKVVVKFRGKRQKTINVHGLLKQGVGIDEIENILTRFFNENDPEIVDVDFVVDVTSVANLVQPETDKLLGNL
jgi:hypothetical protein